MADMGDILREAELQGFAIPLQRVAAFVACVMAKVLTGRPLPEAVAHCAAEMLR